MTQIVQKTRPASQALSTLADDTTVVIETSMSSLDEPAFLFEYEASGQILTHDLTSDQGVQGGGSICLIRADLSDANLDLELNPDQITKTEKASGDYLAHQRLFAIAEMMAAGETNINASVLNWHLRFAPRKKGGIPLNEGSGWTLVYINRSGSAMTTGAIVTVNSVRQRFAWGGF